MSSRRIRHEPHTCSELSYRIVLWNASVVQKHSINSWSKWKNNGDWELTLPLQVSNRCRIHSWNNHRHSQENFTTLLSCLTRLRQTCKTQNNIVMPVLGLAGRHFQQVKQLRQIEVEIAGTWLQHPRVISIMNAALFVGQSAANMRLPPCNLNFVSTIEKRFEKTSTGFTSIEMVHSHAPQQWNFFGRCKTGRRILA